MSVTKHNPYTFPLIVSIILIVIIILQILDNLHTKQKKYDEAYAEGFTHAVEIQEESLKQREQEIALNWWSGKQDFEVTRNRLCENVNIKKLKQSKEK